MIPTTHHAPLYTPRPPAQVACAECGCIVDPVIGWCAQCDRESHPGDTPDHDPRDDLGERVGPGERARVPNPVYPYDHCED